jgi:hypothetical protein
MPVLVFALDPLGLPPLVHGLACEVAHQVDEVARHRGSRALR